MSQQIQVDFDRLSDSDKRELQQTLNNEMQKAKIQECTSVQLGPVRFASNPTSFLSPGFPLSLRPLLSQKISSRKSISPTEALTSFTRC